MKGNFIASNTWDSIKINNINISLPNLEKKEYKLVDSKLENLNFSYYDQLFSAELEDKVCAYKNLDLQFIAEEGKEVNEVYSLELTKENPQLIDSVKIKVNENAKANITLDYFSDKDIIGFRNTTIEVEAEANSHVKLFVSQRFSLDVITLQSLYIKAKENVQIEVVQVDLGGKKNILSYKVDLEGENANVDSHAIYFGHRDQVLDFNYITNQWAKSTNSELTIKGALLDDAHKVCRAAIDFKRGSMKSKGAEEEYVTLLSDRVRNVAVPILLCTEDDVEGIHAGSSGKIEEDVLFYIMSRGFDESSAKRLVLESQFAEIIDLVEHEETRKKIYGTMDEKLAEV